jgi:plastocyanin
MPSGGRRKERVMKAWTLRALTWAGLMAAAVNASAGDAEVAVRLFQFQPGEAAIKAGTRVVWTNQDDIKHTVTAGTPGQQDGRFHIALPGKGATASHRFTEPGVYRYFCERHQNMRGEIRVEEN